MKFGTGVYLKHICTSCMEYVCESTITNMVMVGNIVVLYNKFNTEYLLSYLDNGMMKCCYRLNYYC